MKAPIDIDSLISIVCEECELEIIKLIDSKKVLDYIALNYAKDTIFYEIVRNPNTSVKTINYIANKVIKESWQFPLTKNALRWSAKVSNKIKNELYNIF